MSLVDKYMKGWRFRSSRPELTPDDDVDVFVTETNGNGTGLARIGDTKLYVDGIRPEHMEKRVRVHVTEYDHDEGVGHGEFREVVGESSYTA